MNATRFGLKIIICIVILISFNGLVMLLFLENYLSTLFIKEAMTCVVGAVIYFCLDLKNVHLKDVIKDAGKTTDNVSIK